MFCLKWSLDMQMEVAMKMQMPMLMLRGKTRKSLKRQDLTSLKAQP